MKNYVILVVLFFITALTLIAGCLSDQFMPADKSILADRYIFDNDPCFSTSINKGRNYLGYNNLAGAKQNLAAVKYVHALNQAQYAYLTDKDDKSFNLANNEAETNYKTAQALSDKIFGEMGIATIIVSALLGGIATRIHAVQTLSTPAEVQVEVDKAVKNETEKLYTQAEVDALAAKLKG
ncbi:MAG: hypothetical protein A2Y13_04330 [Planctomycetes bacterium GWC2_45_44]|nr:MAG: hypothetical protein A2Y13_04330 [Planctomycetes bacterium GWC2_45_44]HBR19456.1 hypothetical protein [Phycisphaerales bacterium]